ncbi:hypothetical protein BMS97_00490 [Leuconostoc mesenteroides subsp. mesenteroides]|uniref:DUF6625 family protein n=1 Tax=Leuconostoc mesenteroides TaxID=1245 RepID=UPI000A041856|nr:DUF6625 family protein [Leuconostoc mesenteroides]ARN63889.1 hypothetical protein A0F18_07530 [Leuconostoc mesenteroides subsp. mesenteroides]MDV8927389.1 hypothetical protein [Leuconostoc mesenteroides]ORI91175.1 hypothetical protein BMS97_00490 [Leuconostoc mesenteroides subsp. mesenteroides]ORI92844.1 hypothetical protein BMS98_03380 [Leuconostoc mesenteroides subsp. mesenteroides]
MLKKIFIIPYFGQLPNYFYVWLSTAEKNNTFDFLIVTDQNVKSNSENVKVIKSSFKSLQEKFSEILGDEIVLDSPYKLNDYRPAFGFVFSDIVKNYDYWGFTDVDTILGKLDDFYTDEYIMQFERIGIRGHLQLFRNEKNVNMKFLTRTTPGFNFSTVQKYKFPMHFDEEWGINHVFNNTDILSSNLNLSVADVSPKHYNFIDLNRPLEVVIYEYSHGKLIEISKSGKKTLVPYAHFQKRKLNIECGIDYNNFLVVPNKIVNINSSVNWFEMSQKSKEIKVFIRYYQHMIRNGELFMHIIYKMRLAVLKKKWSK